MDEPGFNVPTCGQLKFNLSYYKNKDMPLYVEAQVRHILCIHLHWLTSRNINLHDSFTEIFLLTFTSITKKESMFKYNLSLSNILQIHDFQHKVKSLCFS